MKSLRKTVKSTEHIGFLLTLIREDIHHYEHQEERINKWIQKSILSLKHTEISLLEKLRDEYHQKAIIQKQIAKEFQSTLEMFQHPQKYNKFSDDHVYINS